MIKALLLTATGALATAPIASAAPAPSATLIPEVLYESAWGPIAIGLAVAVIALMVVSRVLARSRNAWLSNRLAPHLETGAATVSGAGDYGQRHPALAGLFGATERRFADGEAWRRFGQLLWRADVRRNTVEVLYLIVAFGLGLAVLALLLTGSIAIAILAALIGATAPVSWLSVRAGKRTRAFDQQLPDILSTFASTLKAGHTINHAMQTIVEEGEEPAATEFRRALADTGIGRPLDDALNDMADRIRSKEFRFVLNAVTIQREVGGNLAEILETVSGTVRQRHHFHDKVRGLTAMGRLSAIVLVSLPFVTALALTLLERDYLVPLFETSTGRAMVIAGLVMLAVGALILKRLASFRG